MKHKKGFTLVELIAVIVILVMLSLFMIFIVSRVTERSYRNSFIKEANTLAKAAENKYMSEKSFEVALRDDLYNGTVPDKVCYSIRDDLLTDYVEKDDDVDYHGSVELCYGSNCDYHAKIWLSDGKGLYLDGATDFDDKNDIITSSSTEYFDSCGYETIGSGHGTSTVANFGYTGKEERITVLKDGLYQLETWGAQGGTQGPRFGGYGAYTRAELELKKGQVLYINVGGQGLSNCKNGCKGGYNNYGGSPSGWSSGGGATSIALASGNFKTVPSYRLLVVAGGGGGVTSTSEHSYKHGVGVCMVACDRYYITGPSNDSAAGGGYKGLIPYNGNNKGVGGLSFTNASKTRFPATYCYKCSTDSKTFSTRDLSQEPVEKTVKLGNGYARVTYLDDYSITYKLNGGTVATPNRTSYSKTTDTFTLTNPTKDYYDFNGWRLDKNPDLLTSVTISKGSTGNRTYTAIFSPTEYTISYNLNGGELASGVTNPTSYNFESAAITLNNPSKDGYLFLGWLLNDATSPTITTTIPTGSFGNRTYTALFGKTYDVTYDYNIASYTFPTGGVVLNTGFVPHWDFDMKFEVVQNLPTSGKRYLIIGNYEKSKHYNLEINTSNKLRNYHAGSDRGTSSAAIVFGEDITFTFEFDPFTHTFTSTAVGTETNASVSGSITSVGASGDGLRLGQDYRGGSTFNVSTLSGLKLTRAYAEGTTLSDLPTNVTKSDETFIGWFTEPDGGTQITSSTIVGTSPVTYYAHWQPTE